MGCWVDSGREESLTFCYVRERAFLLLPVTQLLHRATACVRSLRLCTVCGVHILPSWPLRSAQRQRTQPELKRLDPSVETAGYKSHVSIGLQRCELGPSRSQARRRGCLRRGQRRSGEGCAKDGERWLPASAYWDLARCRSGL